MYLSILIKAFLKLDKLVTLPKVESAFSTYINDITKKFKNITLPIEILKFKLNFLKIFNIKDEQYEIIPAAKKDSTADLEKVLNIDINIITK